MASEDSRKHLVERSKSRSTFARWVHRVHLPNDLCKTVVPQVLLACRRLKNLPKAFRIVSRVQLNGTTYRSENGMIHSRRTAAGETS